jgi:hypothetical protein
MSSQTQTPILPTAAAAATAAASGSNGPTRSTVTAAASAASPAVTLPPPSFLAMTETKRQHTEAIALYYNQHQALTAARDDLARFNTNCSKNAPLISLPHSLGASFSQVRFVAVDGDAAFYKEQLDALKTLEQESAKVAFAHIVAGKKKYISHLESLVKTQTFVARASSTYSNFVKEINQLYAARGSSTTVPLDIALLHFETKLRREMESYDAQQIQAALEANRKKRDSTDEEMTAQERIVTGSHDGTNITQIASKAAKSELAQTKKELAAAQRCIMDLQEKFNKLMLNQPTAAASSHRSHPQPSAAKSKTGKRKEREERTPKETSQVDLDAMNDIDDPTPATKPTSSSSSNSQGGGRTQHQSKKHKSGRNERSGGKSTGESKDKQKKQ